MPASMGSPRADGGTVEFCVSGGGGSGSLSKRPSAGLSLRTTANLLEKWKVFPGTVAKEKRMASYEIPRFVTSY